MGILKDNLRDIQESLNNTSEYIVESNVDVPDAETEVQKNFEEVMKDADMGSNLLSNRPILAKAAVMFVKRIKGAIISPIVCVIDGKEYASIEVNKKSMFISYNNQNITAFIAKTEDISAENLKCDSYQTDKLGLTEFFDKIVAILNVKNEVNESLKDTRVAQLLKLVPNIEDLLKTGSRLGVCKQLMQRPEINSLYNGKIANLNQDIMDRIQVNSTPNAFNAPNTPQNTSNTLQNTSDTPNMDGVTVAANQTVTAEVVDISKNVQEAIDACNQEYNENLALIEDTAKDFIDYIRGAGTIGKRFLLITGAGGIGKTFTLEKVLKESGFREGYEYIKPQNFNVTATSLFELFYTYQNRLIILDDAKRLWDDAQKVAFWLAVAGPDHKVGKMGSSPTYRRTYNRRDNYYNEVGDVDAQLRTNTQYQSVIRKMKSNQDRILNGKDITGSLQTEVETQQKILNGIRDKVLANTSKKYPDSYDFNGCIVIITNSKLSELRKDAGDSWDALKSRCEFASMYPDSKVVWLKCKATYQKQIDDTSVPDELTVVPRDRWEEVVKEVEDRLTGKISSGNAVGYDRFDWRILPQVGHKIRSGRSDYAWKKYLSDMMSSEITDENVVKKQWLKYITNFNDYVK